MAENSCKVRWRRSGRRDERLRKGVGHGEEPSFQDPLCLPKFLGSLHQAELFVMVRSGLCSLAVLRGRGGSGEGGITAPHNMVQGPWDAWRVFCRILGVRLANEIKIFHHQKMLDDRVPH